jgi:hypothetical protein
VAAEGSEGSEGSEGPSVCIARVETQAYPPKCPLQGGFWC